MLRKMFGDNMTMKPITVSGQPATPKIPASQAPEPARPGSPGGGER